MAFSLSDLKTKARQVLHKGMSVPALYSDSETPEPVALTVRWHVRGRLTGALDGGYGVQIVETGDRLVFSASELADRGLTLRHNGEVTLTSMGSVVVSLDTEGETDGPENVYWTVVR